MHLQADLGYIVGLTPDHGNKANITIKWSHEFFRFPVHIKFMFTLDHSLLSVQ